MTKLSCKNSLQMLSLRMIDRRLDKVFRETLRLFAQIWLSMLFLFPLIYFWRHGGSLNPPPFFYLNILNALILVIYLSVNTLVKKLGKHYVPFAVMIATVLPLFFFYLAIFLDSSHRMVDSAQSQFSIFPLQFLVLLFVALSYRMRVVNSIIVFLTLLNVVFYALFPLDHKEWVNFMVGTVIRMLTTMTASYLVSRIAVFLKERTMELEQANARLKTLAATRQHLAESQERNRLARELHDTLAHTLSGLTVQLEAAKAYWDADTQKAHKLLEDSVQIARNGLDETRLALKALRATPLEDMGFLLAVQDLFESYSDKGGFSLSLELPDVLDLTQGEEQALYRILQEAVRNIVRHAGAQNVKLTIHVSENILCIELLDDGRGFDTSEVSQGHFGLTGMLERTEMIEAHLTTKSEPDKGTRILITKELHNENPLV